MNPLRTITAVRQGGTFAPPADPRTHPNYHASRGFTPLAGGARKRAALKGAA